MGLMTEKREILAPAPPGRGHRPCHSAVPGSGPAGGPKPPASARPAHGGRFSPAGSGAGLCFSLTDRPVCKAPSRAGGGNAVRFLFPPALTTAPSPPRWQGPSPLPQHCAGIRTGRGPKAPGQRPPRPRRALLARRVGRWPAVVPGPAGLQGTVPRGRGNAMRFLFPPERTKAPSPPQWQGPSPLS